MRVLIDAHERIGGDVVSGGGTGTFDTNQWCTEIQAGSYTLMDTQYDTLDLPFRQALSVVATIISVHPKGWIVADAGLKSLGMDHGNPTWHGPGEVLYCSDEHVTLTPDRLDDFAVGDRIVLHPAHVDPTVARHEQMWLVRPSGDGRAGRSSTDASELLDAPIVERWAVDLRHW